MKFLLAALRRVTATQTFDVKIHKLAEEDLKEVARTNQNIYKKVKKAIRLMGQNIKHPSLKVHKWDGDKFDDNQVWESYAGGWRVFWYYGPKQGEITVVAAQKHGKDKAKRFR